MATLNDLATGALERLFIIIGGESADADDLAVALETLQQCLARLPEYGGGRRMVDVSAGSSVDAVSDQRIVCQVSGLTVTLPENPEDGARVGVSLLSGTADVKSPDRKLESASSTVTISSDAVWIYRADSIDWVRVTDLGGSDESPYGDDADSAIELITAMELAPKFEVALSGVLAESISEAQVFLRSKYSRPAEQSWRGSVPYSLQGPARLRSYR